MAQRGDCNGRCGEVASELDSGRDNEKEMSEDSKESDASRIFAKQPGEECEGCPQDTVDDGDTGKGTEELGEGWRRQDSAKREDEEDVSDYRGDKTSTADIGTADAEGEQDDITSEEGVEDGAEEERDEKMNGWSEQSHDQQPHAIEAGESDVARDNATKSWERNRSLVNGTTVQNTANSEFEVCAPVMHIAEEERHAFGVLQRSTAEK